MTGFLHERHLFVFWRWPRDGVENILNQIREGFEINQVSHLHWTKERIVENFQRFYAMVSGDAYHKYTQAGVMPFLFVIAEDRDPVYRYRIAGGSGYKYVNAKSFDLKETLRRQGGTSLHATNTQREFRRDLMYLTGQRATDYKPPKDGWNGKIEEIHRDIVGAGGWRDLSEMFSVLNEAVDYVVLRNFEMLPDEHKLGLHEDIDFLVDDVDAHNRAASILNKEQAAHTKVGNRKIYCDFRSVPDYYYDPEWCRRILRDKVLIRGFYAPNPEDYFFSLLYHGHVHKPKMSKDYGPRLMTLANEIGLKDITIEQLTNPESAATLLSEFLKGNGYYLTRPNGCPAYNEAFAASVPNVPFMYQSESNFYRQLVSVVADKEKGVNLTQQLANIEATIGSRRWLLRTFLNRLAAYPVDLARHKLSPQTKARIKIVLNRHPGLRKRLVGR